MMIMLSTLLTFLGSVPQEPTYRERLVFPLQDLHVHSSSIVEAPNGDLLVCWFEGTGERTAPDVLVKGSRLRKGSSDWSAPFVLADTPDIPDLNPVFFVDANQELWMFWIAVPAERWEDSILRYRKSRDYSSEGAPIWYWQDIIILKPGDDFPEWVARGLATVRHEELDYGGYAASPVTSLVKAARDLSKRQRGWMPRNHVLRLPSGRLLLPLYSDGFYVGLMAISDDGGETWQASSPIPGVALNQPSVVRKHDGTLVAYMRREGPIPPPRVQISTSSDDGQTWTVAADSDIPNPNASLEVVALRDGRWLMIYNDVERGRHSLALALSEDEGDTWRWKRRLEYTEGGQFHYPSMIQSQDGRIHITYTYQPGPKAQKSIKHVDLEVEWVRQGDPNR